MTIQYKKASFYGIGKNEVKGVEIGKYDSLLSLHKFPIFACLLGNKGSISSITTRKNGKVFIAFNVLKDVSKIKVCYGRGAFFKYEIWRNIKVEEYIVTCDVTEYKPEKRASKEQAIELQSIPF